MYGRLLVVVVIVIDNVFGVRKTVVGGGDSDRQWWFTRARVRAWVRRAHASTRTFPAVTSPDPRRNTSHPSKTPHTTQRRLSC